eukprot:271684-Pyramimonas_sp.AAC.1
MEARMNRMRKIRAQFGRTKTRRTTPPHPRAVEALATLKDGSHSWGVALKINGYQKAQICFRLLQSEQLARDFMTKLAAEWVRGDFGEDQLKERKLRFELQHQQKTNFKGVAKRPSSASASVSKRPAAAEDQAKDEGEDEDEDEEAAP